MLRDECFEKLEQFILDEDRIVTYKILSQELKIHVNMAKQYLEDFLAIQKSKNTHILASYFIAGFTDIDGIRSLEVLVVTQRNLEKVKEKFSAVTSCHIYSLSKCNVDECALLVTERDCCDDFAENIKYSAIKPIHVETKPVVLKSINLPKNESKLVVPKKQESAPVKNKSSSFFQSKQKEKNTANEISKIENVPEKNSGAKRENSDSPSKKANSAIDTKNEKSNTLTSMWQKKEEKSKSNKTESSKSEGKGKLKSPVENTKKVSKNNIMSMFSKQAERNSENTPKKSSMTNHTNESSEFNSPKEEAEDPLETSHSENKPKNKKPAKSANTKRKSTSNRQTKKSSKKNDNDSDDDFQPKKKHRRICAFQESDSESENEEAKDRAQCNIFASEDPLESPEVKSSPTLLSDDSEEPIPPTPPVLPAGKGKKKVWKTVQKTYQDEDGFFVTKQEKKLVSESESDEDNKPSNKSTTNKHQGTANLFSYRKQASLTSFFKKS